MKKALFLIAMMLAVACQSTHSPITPKLGEEIKVGLNQQVTFPDEGFSIQFNDLLEDSRCPKGVTCVWAGNAKVAIQFNKQIVSLNTFTDYPKQATVSGYTIQLVSVSPYPIYEQKIQEKEYIVTLIVIKK
ncbi:MAG TPA: hypothetical protein VF181_02355 [Balneolaceae bacterium]